MGEGLKRAFRAVRENNKIVALEKKLKQREELLERMVKRLQECHMRMVNPDIRKDNDAVLSDYDRMKGEETK